MRKNGFIILFIFIFVFITFSSVEALNYTMSWSFQSFNNPNARQVNMNVAETQAGMVEEAASMDPLERFKEQFERRMISSIQRSIVERIRDEDAEGPAEGSYQVGDLEITISEDQLTGEVTLDVVNIITGESTTISYSDEWLSGGL